MNKKQIENQQKLIRYPYSKATIKLKLFKYMKKTARQFNVHTYHLFYIPTFQQHFPEAGFMTLSHDF